MEDWAVRLRQRLRDGVRLPLIILALFTSAMVAWLGVWTVWRVAELLFKRYLERSWV